MSQVFRGGVNFRVAILSLCVLALGGGTAHAAQAPDGNSVLVLGSTVRKAASNVEVVEAAAAGYTVVVASDTEWAAMTAAEFATYRAIVLGDGMCLGSSSLAAAVANRDVWGSAVTGNVIAIGTHPGSSARVRPDAKTFVRDALSFAGGAQSTGAYVTLGCYMSSQPTEVSVLEPFGKFSVVRQDGCSREVQVVATDPALSNVKNANMSGWKCTSDASFIAWPESFDALAIATNVPGQFIGLGGVTGSPSILVRGAGVSSILCGNGIVDGAENCDDGNLLPGDGCSGRCHVEVALESAGQGVGTGLEEVTSGVKALTTANISFPMSGSHDFFNQPVDLSDSGWGFQGDLRLFTDWKPNSKVSLQYQSSLVRQGETPGMVDTLDPGHGDLCVGVEADLSVLIEGSSFSVGGVSESLCGDCPLGFGGDPVYPCTIGEDDFQLLCVPVVPPVEACVALTLTLNANVTPQNFSTDRTVLYDGTPGTGPDTLTFPPSPQDDPFRVSCRVPEGADAVYQLANPTTSPSLDFEVVVGVAGQECDPITGCNDIINVPLLPIPITGTTLDLTGPSGQVDLGPVQKDNTPPDLTNVNASYSGAEGSPIQFSAAGAVDNCIDTVNWVWNFSDHGVAYGFSPFHTFQDNATFSGQLVATDLAGNQSTKALTIPVSNVPPVVHAGPDTTAPWGAPVAFNGSATDPGAADQATLQYQWSFGDGSPSATGGPSVQHAYSAPGTYTATLTVCDKDEVPPCPSDTRTVLVRKRDVTIGYLGDQHGVYDTLTNLTGSLVDELGSVVPGRTITFAIGAEAGGSAATNSSGIASTTHLLGLDAGTYSASATFAGDSLYSSALPSAATYTVDRKPTSVAYTGALSGGPNKTINLSAVLKDSQSKPLAGRVIAFQLGSQSASATTDASGVAATTLKLTQKNANCTLTSTFTPAGADANRYVGNVASVTFKLQAK
jgi:cysteine-rich repeat protein